MSTAQLMTVNALTLAYVIPILKVPGGVPAPAAEEPPEVNLHAPDGVPAPPLMVLVHTGQRVRGFTSYTSTRLIFELESGGQVRIWDGVSTYIAADGEVHVVCSSKVESRRLTPSISTAIAVPATHHHHQHRRSARP